MRETTEYIRTKSNGKRPYAKIAYRFIFSSTFFRWKPSFSFFFYTFRNGESILFALEMIAFCTYNAWVKCIQRWGFVYRTSFESSRAHNRIKLTISNLRQSASDSYEKKYAKIWFFKRKSEVIFIIIKIFFFFFGKEVTKIWLYFNDNKIVIIVCFFQSEICPCLYWTEMKL